LLGIDEAGNPSIDLCCSNKYKKPPILPIENAKAVFSPVEKSAIVVPTRIRHGIMDNKDSFKSAYSFMLSCHQEVK
jgi:hypothetical protein